MPGHVHTLGILKHSRSRHDRNNRELEDNDCLLGDNEELSFNPTGDPLLDAKMLAEQEELLSHAQDQLKQFRLSHPDWKTEYTELDDPQDQEDAR